jgi:hypothetical protein
MSGIKKIRLGLEIIEKYAPDDCPEYNHDIIYAGVDTPEKMTAADSVALDELGWFVEADYNCWAHY